MMSPTPGNLGSRVLCAAVFALLASPTTSSAAESNQIFKCIDASGNVTYQNEACPKAAKSGRVELFDNRWSATKEEREAEWRRNANEHRVVTGMPAQWVREALGDPKEIRDTPTAGAAQLWLYTLPERSIQVGMLNDQVLWFRETPMATGQAAGRGPTEQSAPQVSQQAAPQISRTVPPVDRPANLPTTRLAPPPPERPTAATPATSEVRSADAAVAAQGSRIASGPVTTANDSIVAGASSPNATAALPDAAAATAPGATVPAASAPTAMAMPPAGPSAPVQSAANVSAPKAAGPRTVARGQDCKQALADLGPPSRQRDMPAVDTSSDPATEYFYESSDAGRLRIVCSNGKIEGVDRTVAR